MEDRDREWEFHLRSLSSSARDSNYATDPASDPSILNSIKRLYELCKSENSEELIARVYPHLFQERHWTSPAMAAALQAVINSPQSDRLKEALKIAPRLLDSYFASAVHDANDSLICALIPLLMARYSSLFPDKMFSYEIQRRLVELMLAAFHRSPHFIALGITPVLKPFFKVYYVFQGEASHISGSSGFKKSSQSRLLCFVVTAIAKLATYHRELLTRARVSLAKIRTVVLHTYTKTYKNPKTVNLWHRVSCEFEGCAHSRISDARVWKRAQDCLSLMNEPAVCMSILGPVHSSSEVKQYSGIVNWDEGSTKMIA